MIPILPSRPNVYTGNPLDRAASLRDDAGWIAAAAADAGSLVVPLWRGQVLVRGERSEAVFLRGIDPRALAGERAWAFLGRWQERAVFAAELGADTPPPALGGDGSFVDLRAAVASLPAEEAAVLAHARALLHWRARHRFCGFCGGACAPRSAGHVMVCGQCDTSHFPRTDPAVIMLVVRGEHALLGHAPRFPAGMYSTLAGFVEPGESLEEAVAREVAEETAVRVGAVRYHSSQPWPFPASVMLGFHAEAMSEEIRIDRTELDDARWFSRAALRAPQALGISLPRGDSIARRLIEDWLAAAG